MSKTTAPTLRTIGGSVKGKLRDKRKHELVDVTQPTQLGETRIKHVRTLGGTYKVRPLRLKYGNLFDPQSKTSKKVEIKKVIENAANRTYARMNILTKGCVVETTEGNAIVVNRPGQDGQVSLVKKTK